MISLRLRLFLSFLIALVLTILPLPELLAGGRPPWVLLLALLIQFYMPNHFKVTILFIIGLFLDVLLATVFGEHVLALSLVAWLASNKARRFYFFPIGQQMTLIGIFCFIYQLIVLTIDAFLGFHLGFISILGSTAISILLWPWVRLLAEEMLLTKVKNDRPYRYS